ncbi:Amidohydrolase family [Verrucomicrobiia bacterium DG1235]|nr:Amidohydrolase family [Verrucomicrobiae bacterium DG1235]
MPLKLDAHQHFWTFEQSEYKWIEEWMDPLRRDITPADLDPELAEAKIDGTIAVEARGSLAETENLLRIAAETDFVRGVVGWLPLTDPKLEALLERYTNNPKLIGLRHAISAEPDSGYMFRKDVNQGISLLKKFDLTFDLSFTPHQLPICLDFVDQHPEQTFVLDHLAKPYIRDQKIEPWKGQIRELAKRPNVFCKLSGLATEADIENWIPKDLDPYLDTVLEAFTPNRLMFGSDWPVCLLATDYQRWVRTIEHWTSKLTATEQESIWSTTARRAYRITEIL